MRAELQRLRAEIAADRTAFTVQLRELASVDLGGAATRGDLSRAAIALHHGYSAVESILLRVARAIEGSEPAGPDWHQALLESMGLEIPTIRPAVLASATVAPLRKLLAFRHFFRHPYSVELEAERLAELRTAAHSVEPLLAGDLDRLDRLLERMAAAADQ